MMQHFTGTPRCLRFSPLRPDICHKPLALQCLTSVSPYNTSGTQYMGYFSPEQTWCISVKRWSCGINTTEPQGLAVHHHTEKNKRVCSKVAIKKKQEKKNQSEGKNGPVT